MTQHTELIERLHASSRWWFDRGVRNSADADAIYALEAQAREIAGLQAARMAYAREFPPDGEGEPDVGSIHQNIRAMKAEIERLRKDAERYAWLRGALADKNGKSHWFCCISDGRPEELDAAIDEAMKGQP